MATKQRKGVADARGGESQRLNVRIEPDAYQRLMVHCVMSGLQPGKYLESLINAHCREWRVQAIKGASNTHDDRLDSGAHVSLANPLVNL
jgi:hypothetical protein